MMRLRHSEPTSTATYGLRNHFPMERKFGHKYEMVK